MPWKECNKMDERVRFVARLLEGEKMAPLCRSFGISRKTGYKIFQRYKDMGLEGLTDRSTRPYQGLPSVDYPFHDKTVTVTACGRICLKTKKVDLSNVFGMKCNPCVRIAR
jgi:hypothetical protein